MILLDEASWRANSVPKPLLAPVMSGKDQGNDRGGTGQQGKSQPYPDTMCGEFKLQSGALERPDPGFSAGYPIKP
jgi:hypothetical protein